MLPIMIKKGSLETLAVVACATNSMAEGQSPASLALLAM
jgi:hypothetical protein